MNERDQASHKPQDQPAIWRARYRSVRRGFRSDEELARVLGLEVGKVARWKDGESPVPGHRERLLALDVVVELLTGFLEPPSIRKWLIGFNQHLGGARPVDVIRQGRISDVFQAIQSERTGSYS